MTDNHLATTLRTHLCGALRASDVGQRIRLGGWVHRNRDLGGLAFVDLRDRAGIVQVSFDPKHCPADVCATAAALGPETVVLVEGEVVARPEAMKNPELATGDVEVRASALTIAGPATPPAIPIARARNENLAAEELRLRHRFLDLRRPELQENIVLRHRLMQVTRRYLSDNGFFEIETPILTKPTPEGARDYLVPSRVHAGEFYALPQSPQLYKQLLMVSGFDRYFQIARCFRDEDLRQDRQPEFTQIDIEASFIQAEDILRLSEGLVAALWREGGVEIPLTFPRMTYAEAMERYGSDRPDTRYALEIFDASDAFRAAEFAITRAALDAGGRIRGIRVPGGATLSRKQVDEIEAEAKKAGAAGLLRLKFVNGAFDGPVAKFLPEGSNAQLKLAEGDLALFVAGSDRVSSAALDRVRQDVARRVNMVPESEMRFLWVTEFPLFEWDKDGKRWSSLHHPFTSPVDDDLSLLASDPGKVRAKAYDLVLNGYEVGGGSIRIHDSAMQAKVFELLSLSAEEAQDRFGFFLEALTYGTPPHGGIALGLDRMAMLLAGENSLRQVIAFPKTASGTDLMTGSPSPVRDEQVRELGLLAVRK